MSSDEVGSFAGFRRASDLINRHRGVMSAGSLGWIVRRHRQELVASGEFIPGKGRRPNLFGPKFPEIAIALLRQESAQEMAAGMTAAKRGAA